MGKNFKKYGICFLSVLFGLLALFVSTNYIFDPMFRFHGPFPGIAMSFDDGRYQNPGILRNFKYDSLILGTSVSANFKTSQFDEYFNAQTAKVIFLDGHFSEFKRAIDIANETHEVKRVFWGIDSNILLRNDKEFSVDIPEYMYEKGFANDIKYLLNKGIFLTNTTQAIWKTLTNTSDTRDSAYSWGHELEWNLDDSLQTHARPPKGIDIKNDVFLRDMHINVTEISQIVSENPNTEFYLYMAPYSMLYWDSMSRSGLTEAVLNAHQKAMERLVQHKNVHMLYFMNNEEIISDLQQYTDLVHYSPKINEQLAQIIGSGSYELSYDEIPQAIDSLRQFIAEYDFEQIFANTKNSQQTTQNKP